MERENTGLERLREMKIKGRTKWKERERGMKGEKERVKIFSVLCQKCTTKFRNGIKAKNRLKFEKYPRSQARWRHIKKIKYRRMIKKGEDQEKTNVREKREISEDYSRTITASLSLSVEKTKVQKK